MSCRVAALRAVANKYIRTVHARDAGPRAIVVATVPFDGVPIIAILAALTQTIAAHRGRARPSSAHESRAARGPVDQIDSIATHMGREIACFDPRAGFPIVARRVRLTRPSAIALASIAIVFVAVVTFFTGIDDAIAARFHLTEGRTSVRACCIAVVAALTRIGNAIAARFIARAVGAATVTTDSIAVVTRFCALSIAVPTPRTHAAIGTASIAFYCIAVVAHFTDTNVDDGVTALFSAYAVRAASVAVGRVAIVTHLTHRTIDMRVATPLEARTIGAAPIPVLRVAVVTHLAPFDLFVAAHRCGIGLDNAPLAVPTAADRGDETDGKTRDQRRCFQALRPKNRSHVFSVASLRTIPDQWYARNAWGGLGVSAHSLTIAVVVFALSTVARAQELDPAGRQAAAEAAYDRGTEAYRSGDYARAAHWYETANRLAPAANALAQAIRSYMRAENLGRAAMLSIEGTELYGETLAPHAVPVLERAQRELVRISVQCEDCELQVDGEREDHRVLFVSADVEHTIVARFAHGSRVERVSARAGDSREVVFDAPEEDVVVVAPPPIPPPVVQPVEPPAIVVNRSEGWSPAIVVVGASLTAVALGLTLWSGFDTLSAADAYERMPTRQRLDAGRGLELRTNFLIGTTAVFAIATALTALFLTDWDDETSERPMSTAWGSWIPGGAVVGAQVGF